MGHAIEYIIVDKRKDIMPTAEDFAYWNVDEQENPSRSYHGNLKIHDTILCESYEDAVEKINALDRGWYDDHAVQFKDKSQLKPTKQMETLIAKILKCKADRETYLSNHSVRMHKSEMIGCKNCGSKIARNYLRTETCPVCGKDLRAEYIIERLKKYNNDIEQMNNKFKELQKKQTGKCPIKWLVKVEVHC